MAAIPVTIVAMIYPKDKSEDPYPATILGYAQISGLDVGGGPILPPDEVPPVEPPLQIWPPETWGGSGVGDYIDNSLPEPETPPDQPPAGGSTTDEVHEGWNFNDGKNPEYPNVGWYYVFIPDEGTAQPKRK